MKVAELTKRDFKRNPLMVVDQSLDKFKDHKIPQIKIDSANEISKMESYKSLRKELLRESEEVKQLPTEVKRHFLEIISTFGQFGEQMRRKSDIRNIAETLGGIADAAQEYTLREGGDWFDRVTIKRNMKELKALHEKFQKEAIEALTQEQRLEALYEDMGHVLNRYFEIANVSEEVMRRRLGLKEAKYIKKSPFEHKNIINQITMKNRYKNKENISEQAIRSIIRRIIISEGFLNKKAKSDKHNVKESILNETKFYAFFNNTKHEIEAKDLRDAKQKAITMLKVPKSKVGYLAIVNAKEHDGGSYRFESINEKRYDIGSGWLGNGLTIWNRAETDSNTDDYKIVAQITNKGILSIKDKELPTDIKKMLQVWADSMKKGNRPPLY